MTLPMMMAVQEICDRTALATGDSLGRLARRKFSRKARGRPGSSLECRRRHRHRNWGGCRGVEHLRFRRRRG
ncbi:hypothetical protein [Arthrobacter gyeryongensis]|uniref:hypothetical protein n=1 Tax=Arthrobacter gyeryongensis TaxID=1650592 RepID=UPI003CD0B656